MFDRCSISVSLMPVLQDSFMTLPKIMKKASAFKHVFFLAFHPVAIIFASLCFNHIYVCYGTWSRILHKKGPSRHTEMPTRPKKVALRLKILRDEKLRQSKGKKKGLKMINSKKRCFLDDWRIYWYWNARFLSLVLFSFPNFESYLYVYSWLEAIPIIISKLHRIVQYLYWKPSANRYPLPEYSFWFLTIPNYVCLHTFHYYPTIKYTKHIMPETSTLAEESFGNGPAYPPAPMTGSHVSQRQRRRSPLSFHAVRASPQLIPLFSNETLIWDTEMH